MGESHLVKVTMVVPRSEFNLALKELAEFGWFHPSQPDTLTFDPIVDSLNSRVYRLFLELDGLTRELNIPLQPDLIGTILKGYKVEKEKYTVTDWTDFTGQIEAEAKPVTQELKRLLDELSSTQKSLSEDEVLQATLLMISKFSLNLEELNRLKRFYTVFTVASAKDVKEIRRSLPGEIVVDASVTKSESALLIIGSRGEFDRIEKTLRSFEVKPFTIPERLPQNPAEAYKMVEKNIEQLKLNMVAASQALEEVSLKTRQRLLALREAAYTAYTVLNEMRKSGDLKRFAIIQGYVPEEQMQRFKASQGDRLSFVEEVGHDSRAPTLFTNKGPSKAFQNITLTQGPPKYGEFDPTPIITLVFPIFYGMMFADFGQGLVLFILGLTLRIRGDYSMRQWGTILTAAGVAATFFGLIIGEAFGVELGHAPVIGETFRRLQILNVSDLSQNTVMLILTAGILIGVVHITIGLVLDVMNGFKEHAGLELWIGKIPALIMYLSGIPYALAFIGAGYDFRAVIFRSAAGSLNPTPLISNLFSQPIPVWMVGRVSMPIVVGAVSVLIFGKAVAGLLGKHKEEGGPAMSVIIGLVEFILRLVEFLANTISYARLGILMLVHVSLMVLVKISLQAGLVGLPAAFAWNIAVMLIEGLIVYIQALRLHIYEWFTKFYEGTGTLFQRILPDTRYVEIRWKNPRTVSPAST